MISTTPRKKEKSEPGYKANLKHNASAIVFKIYHYNAIQGIINSGMVENILESAALPGKSPEHFKVLCDHILQFATDRGTVNFANLLASVSQ